MQLLFIRCILTDIPAKIVQIIQSVKIRFSSIDMTDLCDNLTFRSLYRHLYITRNNKYIRFYKPIASAHPIKAVFQTEVLCSAPEHPLSNVQNSLYDLIIIHSNSSFSQVL